MQKPSKFFSKQLNNVLKIYTIDKCTLFHVCKADLILKYQGNIVCQYNNTNDFKNQIPTHDRRY